MDCYGERAVLLALLARHYPSHGYVDDAGEAGFRTVLCIHFPWGQGAWHLADEDVALFQHVPMTESDYDGHTTGEKYDGIVRAVADDHRWLGSSASRVGQIPG